MTLSLTGSIQKKYEYSDYGERSLDSKTEIINNEFGYNGEVHTADGLQYLRARYYDPVTGVFISADSYRGEYSNPLSQNRYTYAHNNPYKYDDPTGHLPITGINKNTVAIFDGTTPTVVSKKKKEEETSTSGSSKPKTTPSPDGNPSSSQVYMVDQVSEPTYVQEYDLNESKDEQTYAVPGMQDKLTENKYINFSDTPVALDTSANQKVPVKIIEDEEVTGKAESSNVGTETRIETGENDFADQIYQETIGELGSQIFENSSKNFDDFITFIATSTGISLPSLSGPKIVYPFKDALNEMSGIAQYLTQEFSKSGANLVKFGSSLGIGTTIGTIFEMMDGKGFSRAFSESFVKAGASSALMMGIVGVSGAIGLNIPVIAGLGVSILVSMGVDYLFENDIFSLGTISHLYEQDIENRMQQLSNRLSSLEQIYQSIVE